MKKKLTLFVFIFSIAVNIFAGVRSEQNAMEIARAFLQKSESELRSATNDLSLAYTCAGTLRSGSEEKPYYYVFNYGNNAGFIIISGNDQAKEVLGYSDQSGFDINNLPSNFEDWLSSYQTEIDYLYSSENEGSTHSGLDQSTSNTEASFATSVSPLLGAILWDQGSPYNDLCPGTGNTKTAVGCVATAMAQIMYYHKWPIQGTGTCVYTTRTNEYSINVTLGEAYDWNDMIPYYNASSNLIQKNAVAKLMYHCGVAVEMDYNTAAAGGSGAYSTDAVSALITNFGYNPNMKYYRRDYTPINEWINIIKTELNAKRPIYYHGSGSGGGHAYVCDGYDANDFFHFNWGWSGSSNGYFQLTALNPSSLGTGGGSGGFNYTQGIITEIQKTTSGTPMAPYFSVGSTTTTASSISRTGTFPISSPMVINLGFEPVTARLGWALYDSNNNFVTYLGLAAASSIEPNKGYNLSYSTLAIPSSVAAGNYKIYTVASHDNDTKRSICLSKAGMPNYIGTTITSNNITFSNPGSLPNLELVAVNPMGNIYNGKTGRFSVKIKNNGNEYHSNIWLLLQPEILGASDYQYINQIGDPISIAPGATETIEIAGSITGPAGSYTLSVFYARTTNPSTSNLAQVGISKQVSVLAAPTLSPALSLAQAVSFPDLNNVNMFDVSLSPVIKNTGGYYEGNVIAFVFPSSLGNSVAYFGRQTIYLEANQEQTVNFSGILSNLEVGVEYVAILYYYPSDWTELKTTSGATNRIRFKLTDTLTGIEILNPEQTKVYPNPTSDKLFLQSEEFVKTIRVFDLSGKTVLTTAPMTSGEIVVPVESLRPGSYILRTETDNDVKSYKFIKQ